MKFFPVAIREKELLKRFSPQFLFGIYKAHYAKFLFILFLGIIAVSALLFYLYAWHPTISKVEISIDTITIPEDTLHAVLEDIEVRKESFKNPIFEPMENPFRLLISEEIPSEQ